MSLLIIPCFRIQPYDCLEHTNFLKVNKHLINCQKLNFNTGKEQIRVINIHRNPERTHTIDSLKNSTTSFLTATMLAYTIGAGITAAAGTRLALQ